MLIRRLALITALAVAIPSIVFSVEQAKPAGGKAAPAVKSSAPTKPSAPAKPAAPAKAVTPDTPAAPAAPKPAKPAPPPKPTQEENLKKFKTAPDSTVVAIVGDEKITKGELTNVLWDWASPLLLDEYMNYRVVMQAAKKQGIQITQADLDKKIKDMPMNEPLEVMLQRVKVPMARFKAGISIQVALEKIIEKETKPTDAEYAEFVKARHILIRATPATPPSGGTPTQEDRTKAEQAAKEKIDKVLAEIKAGKAFEQAAKEYSEDMATKEKGGELGWFRKGEMLQEVSNAAFSLKAGEVSEPVKTFLGYHIVKVDKLGRDATPAEKTELRQRILKQKLNLRMRELFEELKKNTKTENRLSPALPEPARDEFISPPAQPPVRPAPKQPDQKTGTAPSAPKPSGSAKLTPPRVPRNPPPDTK